MSEKNTRRLSPIRRQKDKGSLAAIEKIANYAPFNQNADLAHLQKHFEDMESAQKVETQQQQLLNGLRDTAVKKEWAFHDAVLEAKNAVIGQFGDSSDEVQSIGLKKKSEYKSPTKKPKSPTK